MSWKEVTLMSQRLEFVCLAVKEGANISELCRRFNISRKTGYKFLNRFRDKGIKGLYDQTRKPRKSPNRTTKANEKMILDIRDKYPTWGGRKLKRRLEDLGFSNLPSPSTITAILQRHQRISMPESHKRRAFRRFCRPRPNDLWQMDFKGYFQALDGSCHPLTILDDHSRFSLCLAACNNQKKETVKHELEKVFRKYGLPLAILVDNGSPWGDRADSVHTKLTVWLMRLGIHVIHSRPYHPQTLGKDERFHRTLKADILDDCSFKTISECQGAFDQWRQVYNTERPHESLDMNVPASQYRMSHKRYPETLPVVEYDKTDFIRKVQNKGLISYKNQNYRVGGAFIGQKVAIRQSQHKNIFDIYFLNHKIKELHMKHKKETVTHVPEHV